MQYLTVGPPHTHTHTHTHTNTHTNTHTHTHTVTHTHNIKGPFATTPLTQEGTAANHNTHQQNTNKIPAGEALSTNPPPLKKDPGSLRNCPGQIVGLKRLLTRAFAMSVKRRTLYKIPANIAALVYRNSKELLELYRAWI